MILVDTNVLLRSVHTSKPHYPIVENALAKLRSRQESLCLAPQNVVEFWSVATRPSSENGLGMSAARAATSVTTMLGLFHVLPYRREVLDVWQRIVVAQGVSGKQAHDAHIIAIMQVNSVMTILTFNGSHFSRYSGITVLTPQDV